MEGGNQKELVQETRKTSDPIFCRGTRNDRKSMNKASVRQIAGRLYMEAGGHE